jgi:hypothetical protein
MAVKGNGLVRRVVTPGFSAAAAIVFALVFCGAARAETLVIDVQGVTASDPGKKEQNIPASLNACKAVLKDSMFGTFKDAGKQTVKIAAGGKSNASVGNYGVEIFVKAGGTDKCRMEVTIKEAGKAIGDPICLALTKGHPRMVAQVGSKDAPTILIFTHKDE